MRPTLMKLRTTSALVVAASVALMAPPAAAHPHVFVDAQAEIVFDDQQRLAEIHHAWKFDPAFSEFAIQGLDADSDGELSAAELEPLAEINVTSLREYEFFSYLTIGTERAALLPPKKYWLEYQSSRLTLFFTLPLEEPTLVASHAMLEVFDREYFVEFGFPNDDPVRLSGTSVDCTLRHHSPEELDAQMMGILGAIPMDQRELPPDLVEAVSSLANYTAMTCK